MKIQNILLMNYHGYLCATFMVKTIQSWVKLGMPSEKMLRCNNVDFHENPWTLMILYGIPWKSMLFTMKSNECPSTSIDFQCQFRLGIFTWYCLSGYFRFSASFQNSFLVFTVFKNSFPLIFSSFQVFCDFIFSLFWFLQLFIVFQVISGFNSFSKQLSGFHSFLRWS